MIELSDVGLDFYSGPIRIPPDNHIGGVDTELVFFSTSPTVRSFPSVVDVPHTQLNLTSDSLSVTPGRLPKGLVFADRGDGTALIFGSPAPGTQGAYVIKLITSNGLSPDAEQEIRIVID